ncbi:MAG: hypothetical protein GF341_10875 [candidate division Zixibacteria bacterium]|nr:hypothetical protein [candidate division Zixibacteria bacterium]
MSWQAIHRSLRSLTVAMMILAVAALAVSGCSNSESTPSRFTSTFESPEAMAKHVLRKLKEMDRAGLHDMLITQYEHDSIVAPAMGRTNDLEFGWFMLKNNCIKGVRRTVETYGGRDFEFEYIRFEEGTEPYPPLTLHRGTVIGVTDRETGQSGELGFCGTVIEEDGRFKLVSIRD